MADLSNSKTELLSEYKRLLDEAGNNEVVVPAKYTGFNGRNKKEDLIDAITSIEKLLKRKKSGEKKEVTGNGQMSPESIRESTPKEEIKRDPLPEKSTGQKKNLKESSTGSVFEEGELKLLNQDIINKIEALEKARQLKKDRLEELKVLESELEKAVLLINSAREETASRKAQNERRLKETEETKEKEFLALQNALVRKTDEAREKLSALEAENKLKTEKRDEARRTENEQYAYEQTIRYKKEDDSWKDEGSGREVALKEKQKEFERLEAELEEMKKTVPGLEKKMEELPELIEKASAEGASLKEKELVEEYAHQTALAAKDADALSASLQSSIEALKEDYEALLKEKDIIQAKLDRAYDESNKLYMQTIQSTGGIKILGNMEKK